MKTKPNYMSCDMSCFVDETDLNIKKKDIGIH